MMSAEISYLDEPSPRRRPRWRLRILAAVSATLFGLYGFAQLDRATAERLGPVGEAAHNLLSPKDTDRLGDSPAARRFKADVKALHATPSVAVSNPGVLGIFGRAEDYNVNTHDPAFDDAALAHLADRHGDRITALLLQGTAVTDAGLAALARFPRLRQLAISQPPVWTKAGAAPTPSPGRITDAGMVHLGGLDSLTTLSLNYLPITDAGLAAIRDLPTLNSLYLHGTRVEGRDLAAAKWLPRLSILYLDNTPFSEDGIKSLRGATSLQVLSLDRVPLESSALPLLQALPPRLDQLDLTGCGFLDEEVATLARPGLKITRH